MKILIMAGGKGTRLSDPKIQLPKVMRAVAGKPLLSYTLELCEPYGKENVVIIVGFMYEKVIAAYSDYNFAIQTPQLGTGHAVICGISHDSFENYHGDVLILSGDTPLISAETIEKMTRKHEITHADGTFLTCNLDEKLKLGRILRKGGRCVGIVEDKDATEEQKDTIFEYNAGVYLFKIDFLRQALSQIDNNNSQNEYYLTDVLKIMFESDKIVETIPVTHPHEILGVNTNEDLLRVEEIINKNF